MRRNQGVTIIELLVTISIAVILMTIAAPGLQDFLRNNRVAGVTNAVTGFLHTARSEAVTRGSASTVCPDADGNSTCDGSTDWTGSLIVLVGGTVVKRLDNDPDVTLTSSANSIVFDRKGAASAATTVNAAKGTCPGRSELQLSLTTTGRITSSKIECP